MTLVIIFSIILVIGIGIYVWARTHNRDYEWPETLGVLLAITGALTLLAALPCWFVTVRDSELYMNN